MPFSPHQQKKKSKDFNHMKQREAVKISIRKAGAKDFFVLFLLELLIVKIVTACCLVGQLIN